MQPQVSETLTRNIDRFRGLLTQEKEPAGRRVLERLLHEEEAKLRATPFRWGAPPTD